MKKIIVILIAGFLVLPVRAQTVVPCSEDGYTVVFVNGVFTELDEAKQSKKELKEEFQKRHPRRTDVTFELAYNPEHLAGLGDSVQVVSQAMLNPVSDYDRNLMLRDMYEKVRTQKILLVGHSQGTFYTNEIYEYLVANGVSPNSITVYNLATPANSVRGGGEYLTSENDGLVQWVREWTKAGNGNLPLPANITIPIADSSQPKIKKGHAFSSEYLAGAPGRIIGDINKALGRLSAEEQPTVTDGCFTPPEETVGDKVAEATFAIADPTAEATRDGAAWAWDTTKNAAVFTWDVTKTTGVAIVGTGNAAAQMIGQGIIDTGSAVKAGGTWVVRNTKELTADISGGFGAFWDMAVNRIAPENDLGYLEADLFALVDPVYIEPEEVVVEEEERRMEEESEAREEVENGEGSMEDEPDLPALSEAEGEIGKLEIGNWKFRWRGPCHYTLYPRP